MSDCSLNCADTEAHVVEIFVDTHVAAAAASLVADAVEQSLSSKISQAVRVFRVEPARRDEQLTVISAYAPRVPRSFEIWAPYRSNCQAGCETQLVIDAAGTLADIVRVQTRTPARPTACAEAFQYWSFEPLEPRDPAAALIYVSELAFYTYSMERASFDLINTGADGSAAAAGAYNSHGSPNVYTAVDGDFATDGEACCSGQNGIIVNLGEPVAISYFDWATNSGAPSDTGTGAGSDPVRWVIKASSDGVDWVTKGGAINKGFYEDERFMPSAARGAWQGPFSACGGKSTQDFLCEDFDDATCDLSANRDVPGSAGYREPKVVQS